MVCKMADFIVKDIDLKKTYDSGQVFSWTQQDSEYIIPIGQNLYRASQLGGGAQLCLLHSGEDGFEDKKMEEELSVYFDCARNYPLLLNKISKEHPELLDAAEFGRGIRILKQDIGEMIITFMLSANNHISRIRNTLAKIRKSAGKVICSIEGEDYYAFPNMEELAKISESDYKDFGAGYRAAYLCETTKALLQTDYMAWQDLATQNLIKELVALKGIGPKVAHCISLFGYGRWNVFPVDTWVKKALFSYYKIENNNSATLEHLIVDRFKGESALVQQLMFFYQKSVAREQK